MEMSSLVFGSLVVCACFKDEHWHIPRRPYTAVLAAMLLVGILWGKI